MVDAAPGHVLCTPYATDAEALEHGCRVSVVEELMRSSFRAEDGYALVVRRRPGRVGSARLVASSRESRGICQICWHIDVAGYRRAETECIVDVSFHLQRRRLAESSASRRLWLAATAFLFGPVLAGVMLSPVVGIALLLAQAWVLGEWTERRTEVAWLREHQRWEGFREAVEAELSRE